MGRPNLYHYPNDNFFFCAHDFAKRFGISIRKARRSLSKSVRDGKLVFIQRQRKNLCLCGEVAVINNSWCQNCFPDTGKA
jgi:hypothetical protein